MASLKIEYTSDKAIRTLEVAGEKFVSEVVVVEYGSKCEESLNTQIMERHPEWMDDDDLYEAVENIDNSCDDLDMFEALKLFENMVED